ncbi:MAG TPA: PilZ domain-containing protein [Candidatus Acidoferrales bacterium]
MPTQTSSPKDKGTLVTDPGRRRSMRVLLSVPILVSGKNADNKAFTEEARTLVVNAHGALIALATRVLVNQLIEVANKATEQCLECRVVHVGNAQGGKMQLGLEFVKASPTFWQIDFPPDDWVVPED